MAFRIERPSLWQWLCGKRTERVTLASRFDDTGRFAGAPLVQSCAWCALPCPHTEHAHYIQTQKTTLAALAIGGDATARIRLRALERAEIEFG